jgi:hypothetical protein
VRSPAWAAHASLLSAEASSKARRAGVGILRLRSGQAVPLHNQLIHNANRLSNTLSLSGIRVLLYAGDYVRPLHPLRLR